MAYLIKIYPHTKLDRNRKKTFCERTDGRTHLSSSLLGHRWAMTEQEGQHPLTGQRAANFRLLTNQ